MMKLLKRHLAHGRQRCVGYVSSPWGKLGICWSEYLGRGCQVTTLTEGVDASSNPQAGWKQQKMLKLEDDFLFLQPAPKDIPIF